MNIIGISSLYHDSAACLVQDGQVVAAAQEERFSRKKNTGDFPIQALNFCSQFGNFIFSDVDYFGYFEKPYLKFSRVLTEHVLGFPFTYKSFMRSIPRWMDDRLLQSMIIKEELATDSPTIFLKHHLSHAASSFLPSAFEEAAIFTCDGVGEWATATLGHGQGNEIKITHEINYPHSLGLLYTTFTVFLGFHANGGEGKTMGMAALGEARFGPQFEQLIHIFPDGSFKLNLDFFSFRYGEKMWSAKFEELFGKPRRHGEDYQQRHFDIAASLQKTVESIFVAVARDLQKKTKIKNLCLAGGVALNCVANNKILEHSDFENIFIQPACGDAGGALGAALYISNSILKHPRHPQKHSYLGPEYSEHDIKKAINSAGVKSFSKKTEDEMIADVSELLAQNKIVGWFQGRMEFGPRALGNRSILGNPCFEGIKEAINNKIKKREAFRPYAPLVLKERAADYFDLAIESPYMLLAPQVRIEKRNLLSGITHADGSARVQTVGESENVKMRKLLLQFEKHTGVPVLLNTSFNRSGEPVVCRPEEAVDCFLKTDMDALAVGDFLLRKNEK